MQETSFRHHLPRQSFLELQAPRGTGRATLEGARSGERPVYFEGRFVATPIFQRERLGSGMTLAGPCIVEVRPSMVNCASLSKMTNISSIWL